MTHSKTGIIAVVSENGMKKVQFWAPFRKIDNLETKNIKPLRQESEDLRLEQADCRSSGKKYILLTFCVENHVSKKKSGSIFWERPTSRASSEAPSKTFFDRLDIFSDAIDIKNALMLLVLPHTQLLCCDGV